LVINILVVYVCPSVRLCVRMEQLGSHWMDFQEILCLFFETCSENSSFIEI